MSVRRSQSLSGIAITSHARGDVPAGKEKAAPPCAGCHGANGEGKGSSPALAGKSEEDKIEHALKDYKSGKRSNGVMKSFASKGLSEDGHGESGCVLRFAQRKITEHRESASELERRDAALRSHRRSGEAGIRSTSTRRSTRLLLVAYAAPSAGIRWMPSASSDTLAVRRSPCRCAGPCASAPKSECRCARPRRPQATPPSSRPSARSARCPRNRVLVLAARRPVAPVQHDCDVGTPQAHARPTANVRRRPLRLSCRTSEMCVSARSRSWPAISASKMFLTPTSRATSGLDGRVSHAVRRVRLQRRGRGAGSTSGRPASMPRRAHA